MKKISLILSTFLISTILIGCDNKLNEIKDAVSGIDDQAEKATKAISYDAHSIRSIEISYENETFTINDLFKTILRDTQWEYEQNDSNHHLVVKGVWKEPLFKDYNIAISKDELKEKGKVTVELFFENDKLKEGQTKVHLQYEKETILSEEGMAALINLYNTYIYTTNNL